MYKGSLVAYPFLPSYQVLVCLSAAAGLVFAIGCCSLPGPFSDIWSNHHFSLSVGSCYYALKQFESCVNPMYMFSFK